MFKKSKKNLVKLIIILIIPILTSLYETLNKGKYRDQEVLDQYPAIKIIDGDTMKIGKKRIRLYGIDAPEIKQLCYTDNKPYLCGEVSKSKLEDIVRNKKLACKLKNLDLYKREVSICSVNNQDISSIMVRSGMAVAYRAYSKDYIKDELYAKDNRLGIWAGDFIYPDEWRKRKKISKKH